MPRREKIPVLANSKFAIIGDEDTVTGFLMTGIGVRDGQGKTNFLVVDSKTPKTLTEEKFREFTQDRRDVSVLVINQHIADSIRYLVDLHTATIPTILEIPSKDKPYDAARDSVMQRVKVFFGGEFPQ